MKKYEECCKKAAKNIYSLPILNRKEKFLALLSRTECDTETSARREMILREMKGV